MRRAGRHKFIRISIFFLVYSIIVCVRSGDEAGNLTTPAPTSTTMKSPSETKNEKLAKEELPEVPQNTNENTDSKVDSAADADKQGEVPHTESPQNKNEELSKDVQLPASSENTSEKPNSDLGHQKLEVNFASNASEEEVMTNSSSAKCIPAAIRQFPRPGISQYARKHGALIIHIIVAIYMFIGLAIVCDDYFVASLDRICEELKMSPDVAGATFMAAGSSAPELATVIIGVFYAEDDIGISGVIGSAVFNIMFVISVSALAAGSIVYLNWWPLIRDSIFYTISILIMLLVMVGDEQKVTWIGSTVMLIFYAIYCVVLHFNSTLERWALTLPVPFKSHAPTENSGLVSYKNLQDDKKYTDYNSVEAQPPTTQPEPSQWSPGQEWSPEKAAPVEPDFREPLDGPALNQTPAPVPQQQQQIASQEYYKPKEYDPSTKVNPLAKPEDTAGMWEKIKWGTLYPIHFFAIYTMPDCRSEKYRNWYPFTFFMSMLWISFYSFFMVWMITIIGYTLGVPDTVMGLTFVAAGVSVPDALSSIAVIKEGYGDMAVSNAIGSNVFDILVCLGLPWFLKTAVIQPGSTVAVTSRGLLYSTLSLLSTVVFLVIAVHFNGWKLDRKIGIVLMIWYFVFIIFASLYELNFFGNMNKPECITDY